MCLLKQVRLGSDYGSPVAHLDEPSNTTTWHLPCCVCGGLLQQVHHLSTVLLLTNSMLTATMTAPAPAAQHNGRILVARESAVAPGCALDNATGTGELVDMWEAISSADAVQTPAEVYAKLRAEGLAVRYLRVPVTDGRAPQPGDIDAIIKQVGLHTSYMALAHELYSDYMLMRMFAAALCSCCC